MPSSDTIAGSTNLLLAPTGRPQLGGLAALVESRAHTYPLISLQQGVEQPDRGGNLLRMAQTRGNRATEQRLITQLLCGLLDRHALPSPPSCLVTTRTFA